MVSFSGLAAGYVYKHQWLGIHIYFVPSMSMHPTLKPGQFILLDTWVYQQQAPEQKDVVVFEHDTENLWLVKRIANWPDEQLQHNDLFYVLGDNPSASRDSRSLGGIEQEQVVGKVKLVLLGIDQKHQFVVGSFLQVIQ
jgi:nickel-type superoxide dismutase maturation protease